MTGGLQIISRARSLALALPLICGLGLGCAAVRAGADETVYACAGGNPNNLFAFQSNTFGMSAQQNCGQPGGTLGIEGTGAVADGQRSYWYAAAPGGLVIDEATASSMTVSNLNDIGETYGGGFFWGPSNSDGVQAAFPQTSAGPFGVGQGTPGFPSNDFGFQLVCGARSCPGSGGYGDIYVGGLQLGVGETQGPSISAGGLWDQSGWVRGSWPVSVGGDSPSGVCSYSASISGDSTGASASYPANQTTWHQCSSGGLSGALNTALASNGADTLSVSDSDAAGLGNGASRTVEIDNQAPTLALSGPATASSTSGPAEVTVSVAAGPSGAYGADCSVDGAASVFYPGASSQVAVSGIGPHTVTCTALNNAMSSTGARASSAPASFDLDIQQPSEEAITFSKIKDALKCRKVVRRVKVLGRPHLIRLHGHRVSVRRVRYVKRHVRRCRAQTVRRRVLVPLKRHGRAVRRHHHIVRVHRVRRVVLLPHRVYRTVRHIRHGRGTTVSGVLLLSDGAPVAGQTVTILAAPNDGYPQFAPVSSATTDADGYWVAKIPAGPSRLLEAQYAGTPDTAAASSTTVKLMVPARLRILAHTRRVAWGHTVSFSGRVYGGEIPPGGINLRLRYGYHGSYTTYGVKTHVRANGRFRTSFTFGLGDPRDHVWFDFRFATLPGGGYPWSPAQSNIAAVRVGGHPHPAVHHHRRASHRRHRARRHRHRTQHHRGHRHRHRAKHHRRHRAKHDRRHHVTHHRRHRRHHRRR